MITDNTDIIQRITDDLMAAVQSIAGIGEKKVQVLDGDELMDKSKGVPLPALGVIYEGMRAVGEPGKDTHRTGQSTVAMFTLLLAGFPKSDREPQTKKTTLELLGELRSVLRGRKSPSGHIYRFEVESPADEVKGTVFWAQRWSVPIPVI